MNAQSKIEAPADNLALWNQLAKTDPRHTKGFKRAGGFTGTAIKPIWIIQRLTELFGPVGVGWGFSKPDFTLVPAGDELPVFCTIEAWHGSPANALYGVGGDKVISKNKFGLVVDDEAFKKAFTDALGNAFKFVGVGADVHMGLFDDSKYVRDTAQEFAANDPANDAAGGHSQREEGAVSPRQQRIKLDGPYTSPTQLQTAIKAFVHSMHGCGDWDEWVAFRDTAEVQELIAQVKRDKADWWEGWPEQPPEFVPLHRQIELHEAHLSQQIADIARV